MKISLKQLLPVFAGIIGAGSVLYSTTKYGAGMSPDSAFYISTARSLVEGKGYFVFTGTPMTLWPPLFPTLLAMAGPAGIDPVVTARYLNAASFGGIIFLSGTWLNHKLKNSILALLGLALVVVSEPLFSVSLWVLSEPVFIFFTVAFLILIEKYQENGRKESLYYAAILVGLAVLIRYVGVTLIITGCAVIFLKRHKGIKSRIADAVIFGVVSALPVSVWVARNYLLSLNPAGPRAVSMFSLTQNVFFTAETLAGWFLPKQAPLWVLVIILLLVLAMAVPVLRSFRAKGTERRDQVPTPFSIFLVIYTGWLITSATLVAFDGIDSRLLSPIYAPLIMLAVYLADSVRERADKNKSMMVVYYFSVVLFSLLLIRQGYVYFEAVRINSENGVGMLSVKQWRESELISYVKNERLDGNIFSNAPEAIYIIGRIKSNYIPSKYAYNSPQTPLNDLDLFRKQVMASKEPSYIIWFDKIKRDHLYSLNELSRTLLVTSVKETRDGGIYIVKAQEEK